MNPYEEGDRDLDPFGEMQIQKRNSDRACWETIHRLRNDNEEKIIPRKWPLLEMLLGPQIECLFRFSTEEEWVERAIALAKAMGGQRVVYEHRMIIDDIYTRELVIWDYAQEQKYNPTSEEHT